MSDSEDDRLIPSMASPDNSDDDGPSTSWGLKRRNKCAIISDSENDDDDDDDDDLEEEVVKDDGESGDSDSSDSTPGARTCAICLGRMRGEVGSPDACEHTFCKFCLLEWAKTNATCPQDRIPFTSVLVRKVLGGPISKEVPVPKGPAPDVYEFVETENPTYCEVCNQCNREDRLLLCDGCDLGYHLECLNPPLTQVPVEEWFCPVCTAVDVPETLSHRLSSSSRRTERARRSSSRSGNTSLDQQEIRIPRTRATERIREQIQKKKRKKIRRRRQKERKRARISSGEIEDPRPPVTQFERFRYFIEENNDIDAEHTVDRYADQLLAGATHKSARFPAQRKADAARRLRDVAFTPHASYSGRAKNRVLEIVNIHSEETDNDLLSGILENQTIAFSSSKKLLLTNDRKLIKQPDANFSGNEFQETDSLLLEPLPSQRKSPEKESLASCSNGDSNSDPCKELHKKEDSDGNKQSSSSERQRSPTRTSHHSSSYKEKHGCSYEEKHSYKRESEWHKKDDHNKHTHNHSRYSHHERHHSSRGNSSHYEPSCSYTSKEKSHVSSRWKEKRDHRGYHSSYESHEKYHSRDRSPHKRNRSPGRENRRDRRRSPSSSTYKSHDRKSHFSRSHNPHARSRGESSHSLGRSQWSFDYFNSNDSIISKNNVINRNNPITSGTEVQINSKNIPDKSFSEESTISRSLKIFVQENGCHSLADNLQPQNLSQGITCRGVIDTVESQRQEGSLSEMNEVSVSIPGHCLNNEGEPNSEVVLNKNCKEIEQKDNACSGSIMVPEDDKQDQKNYISNKISDDDDYKRSGKSSAKLPLFKKTKMSALFGEFENGTTTDMETKECKVHMEHDGDLEEERVKYSKFSKKSKTELLFGNDSDSNSNSDVALGHRHEIAKNKSGKINPKDIGNTGGNSSHHKNVKNAVSECEAEEYDPVCGSTYLPSTISETEIKLEKSHEDNKVMSCGAHVNKLPTATATALAEKDFESRDRVSWTKHVFEEKELKIEGNSHTQHRIKDSEVEEIEKFDKRKKDNFSRNNNGKEREREQKNHIIGRKALENGDKGDKYVSRKESYSASHEKCHRGEKEIKLNYKSSISENELNPLLDGKHSTKEGKFKASDNNDSIVSAKKESKSDLYKKHHTNSKESESQNNVNQRIRSDSYLSEKQNSKGKDSDLCGKVPSKGKDEKSLKYTDNEEELDAEEKLHTKEREPSDSLDEKGKVKIPEKYKQKLSRLENLISKDDGTDFWEMPTFGNDFVIKVDNSKNKGVGRKSSSKGSFLFEKKNEEKDGCSAFKESRKKDDSLLKYSKYKDAKLEIEVTAQTVLKIDKKKVKVRQDSSQDKKQKDGHILNDLFGEIDDIGSSSCSNLPETEFEDQPQSARINTCPKESVKDGKTGTSLEGKIMKPKDFQDVALGGCDSVSVLRMDGKHTDNEADGKGLAMFRCTPVSKDKADSAVRNDAGSRIKQQKALLEARVVEEVKKSLDPFYRSKSITKDEYKQIVAKCVKKVVKAECGDVIEPEKMHTLVLGYIKVYKHRQKHTNIDK